MSVQNSEWPIAKSEYVLPHHVVSHTTHPNRERKGPAPKPRAAAWRSDWRGGAFSYRVVTALLVFLGTRAALAQVLPQAASNEASEPPNDPLMQRPVDEATAQRIEKLVALLSSPEYAQRSAAVEDLISIGPPAFRPLRDAYVRSDDLETVLQIERIVRTAYLNREVYSQHGFLGVSLRPYPFGGGRDVPQVSLPAGTPAVQFVEIIEHSGASRAGLQKWDVIIAVDGKPLTAAGQELVESFSRSIGRHKPGDQMTLTVVRREGQQDVQQDVDVTLGRIPPERARSVLSVRDRIQDVTQDFDSWWSQNFRRPTPPSPPSTP